MIQMLLPLSIFRPLPPVHSLWFQWANAANYTDKKAWFYPLKTRILKSHAVSDGLDLQTITRKCWSCHHGIWISESGRHSDICFRCNGSGIFSVESIVLSRWILNGDLYHCPERHINPEIVTNPRNHFTELLKHQDVPPALGVRALGNLLFWYEPLTWLRWMRSRFLNWWKAPYYFATPFIRAVYDARRAWRDNFTEAEDIPF